MIECICINDKNKPEEIPQEKWVTEGAFYNITEVMAMTKQGASLGCILAEIDLTTLNLEFEYFRLDRFAIHVEDFSALNKLVQDFKELNDIPDSQIQSLLGIQQID